MMVVTVQERHPYPPLKPTNFFSMKSLPDQIYELNFQADTFENLEIIVHFTNSFSDCQEPKTNPQENEFVYTNLEIPNASVQNKSIFPFHALHYVFSVPCCSNSELSVNTAWASRCFRIVLNIPNKPEFLEANKLTIFEGYHLVF